MFVLYLLCVHRENFVFFEIAFQNSETVFFSCFAFHPLQHMANQTSQDKNDLLPQDVPRNQIGRLQLVFCFTLSHMDFCGTYLKYLNMKLFACGISPKFQANIHKYSPTSFTEKPEWLIFLKHLSFLFSACKEQERLETGQQGERTGVLFWSVYRA